MIKNIARKFRYFTHPDSIIMDLCYDYSIEFTPRGYHKISNIHDYIPQNTKMYITFIPNTDYREIVETSKCMSEDGFNPVPHIPARSIKDYTEFYNYLSELKDKANINRCLIIGGGSSHPVGEYHKSMQIIRTGLLEHFGIEKVGIAGHPEGNPAISLKEIKKSLLQKQEYNDQSDIEFYITTQFCFNSKKIMKWENWLRTIGINMQVHLGIPGPANVKTLARYAKLCGVDNSFNFFLKNPKNMANLGYASPNSLVRDISFDVYKYNNTLIKNLHVYPFGGIKKSSTFMNNLKMGYFDRENFK